MISEAYEKKTNLQGDVRKYRVWLDPNQYRMDMESRAEKGTEVGVYEHLTFIHFCIISANLFRGKSRGAQQRRFRTLKIENLVCAPGRQKYSTILSKHIFLMIIKIPGRLLHIQRGDSSRPEDEQLQGRAGDHQTAAEHGVRRARLAH